ncbi:Protein of unknown function, DUF488 [Dyadobacter koreensis]|uniref:DUF488 domain-containing protein n=1 Tax=Dyadobacter koreensis TaxID=408657 RepID=A0A1H7BAK6_9BACT|nr:DUF488 domain-containing protein [Dyadobacter koreensis]SEJ73307.1 Protein of unknown function, DUF488 [Dyadobacter koreensis]
MIHLFTIGFTKKPAETFFKLLKDSGVKQIVDTRINNVSQLSGFAKGSDLQFFAREIGNISYDHNLDFAPTKELLSLYRTKKLTWNDYETEYLNLLDIRKIAQKINVENLHQHCLLCSEHKPDKCHRRLLAEYLKQVRNDIKITHLI